MSQDQPIRPADDRDDGTPERVDGPAAPAVVEWGDEEPAGRSWAGWAPARTDRRIPPIVAGLGAVALLGSLLSEWRIWELRQPESPPDTLEGWLVSFPAVGPAYLIGLLILAVCAALVYTGAGALAVHARVIGLAVCGLLGAILLMSSVHLEHLGGAIDEALGQNAEVSASHGRGLYLAYAGVAAVALAFYLLAPRAARTEVSEPARPAPADDPPAADPALDDWPWRPEPRRPTGPTSGPVDLTVEPATPFVPPPDETRAR